ncbi:hypothetical protein CYLTODRAFT_361082, partial [Cylindrobasidium torrendii FP15055 ss-10]
MLVARVRHNACFVKVSGGYGKQVANCVAYELPIPRVYQVLPPPKADLDDVAAVFFSGPKAPTLQEWKRLPLLVRPSVVMKALNWLRLNNDGYADIDISHENLRTYPTEEPPIGVFYKCTLTDESATVDPAVNDEKHADTEETPFIVHGMIGTQLETMTFEAMKAKAMSWFDKGGGVLAIGQEQQPQSMYNNPSLYPLMFPWLFPYGRGGLGSSSHLNESEHIKWLLMYHDK